MNRILNLAIVTLGLAAAAPALADDRSKLTVEFNPITADMEGARWRLVGAQGHLSGWRRSGATVTRVPDGIYTIEYEDPRLMNSAATCEPPPAASEARHILVRPNIWHHVVAPFSCGEGMDAAAVPRARLNQSPAAASITVILEPALEASTGAAWSIDGGPWQRSSAVVRDLTEGDHVLTFKPVSSGPCTQPPEREVIAVYLGGVTTLTRRYGGQGC